MARLKHRRERQALHAAIEEHGAMVFRLASRILGNAADAEDVSQEVFLRYLRVRLRGQTRIADARSWLAVTALNSARNFRRSEQNRRKREEHWAREYHESSPSRVDDDFERVWQVALGLPDELRVPLILHYQEGFKYREIAKALSCPEGTIATRISTAKERIRSRMQNPNLHHEEHERHKHEESKRLRSHRGSSSKRA